MEGKLMNLNSEKMKRSDHLAPHSVILYAGLKDTAREQFSTPCSLMVSVFPGSIGLQALMEQKLSPW